MKASFHADEAGEWFDGLCHVLRAIGMRYERSGATSVVVHRPTITHGRWGSLSTYHVKCVQSKPEGGGAPQRIGMEVCIYQGGRCKTVWEKATNDINWRSLVARTVAFIAEDIAHDVLNVPVETRRKL
jgi:hypothetical protein